MPLCIDDEVIHKDDNSLKSLDLFLQASKIFQLIF